MQLHHGRSTSCWLETELIGWSSQHNGASRFSLRASCCPPSCCLHKHKLVRSRRPDAWIINLTQMTSSPAPSYSNQCQSKNNETENGPLRVVYWAFNFILEWLPAADLQRCTEQHREVRFHSGSTCWKTTNAFSLLGSTSTLSLYLSRSSQWSSAKITPSYFA